MSRLRFGIFLAPFHPAGENPTLALERDLELIAHLDRLGYDEAWIGEHHSAGSEIIASPEIFIATAAERTRHIRLGTGVTSVAYHNPLWVAERMVLLDHLTRGRTMLGLGPGSLPTDSAMIGLNPTDTRELLDQNLDIIMRLLRSDEPVTAETATHKLYDARLHLRPYTEPHFDIAVAAVASPTGPRLAGRYGLGLLSVGGTLTPEGVDALGHHWGVGAERARAQLGRRRGARAGLRADGGPQGLAARRPRARRGDPRAGLQGRRVRHRAVVPVLRGRRGLPADGHRGRAPQARDGRVRQHVGRRRDRHLGGRGGADLQAPDAEQRRVRGVPHARPRVGEPRGDEALLRAHRPARHAHLPGPRAADDRRAGARVRDPRRDVKDAERRRRAHDGEVRAGGRREPRLVVSL